MLGCIQPMSSPMMKRMFGFCGVCAAAGVLAGPDNASDISADAPSSAARQPAPVLCWPSPVPGDLWSSMQSDMNLSSGG